MAFLVRKLSKRDKLSDLGDTTDVRKINADIPTAEFRTSNGTLSTWIIDSLEKLNEAVLAIAVSSTEITKMDFIIIDTDLLSNNGLEYMQTYAGQDIAVPDLQDTHYDIINVSIEKLVNCTQVYQSIVKMDPEGEKYILRFAAGEIRDIIKEAILANRINEELASKKLKLEIEKLKVS